MKRRISLLTILRSLAASESSYNQRTAHLAEDGEPESGKIVAVHVPDDGLIVKRLQKVNGTWLLASDNPAHPPRPLREGERIFGVARAVVRRV